MVLLRYLASYLKPDVYGPGYIGLIKQGFTEVPHYMFAIPLNIIGLVALTSTLGKWRRMEGHKRRFMECYTIMRSDNPHKDKYFYIDVNDKSNIKDVARKCYYDKD